jgi:hypothetical protein
MAIFGEYYKSALPMMERVAEFDAAWSDISFMAGWIRQALN